jgi:hypothetical protein
MMASMSKDTRTQRRQFFQHQLGIVERKRLEIQNRITGLMLKLADGGADAEGLEGELEQAQQELDSNERTARNYAIAQAGAAKMDSAAGRAQLAADHRKRLTRIDKLGTELEGLAEQLVEHAEAFAPLLAKFAATSGERQELARAVLRDADDTRLSGVGAWNHYRRLSGWAESSPVCVALVAALWRSGLGRVGPNLEGVNIEPPHWDGPWGRDADLPAVMHASLEKFHAGLRDALERAVQSLQVAE